MNKQVNILDAVCFWCQLTVYAMWGAFVWLISPAPLWAKVLGTVFLVLCLVGTARGIVAVAERGAK